MVFQMDSNLVIYWFIIFAEEFKEDQEHREQWQSIDGVDGSEYRQAEPCASTGVADRKLNQSIFVDMVYIDWSSSSNTT